MTTLDLNDEQLAVISKACELFARIHMGQLEEIAWLFSSLSEERYQELTEGLKELNTLITQMPKQSHFGIRSEQVAQIAKSAYDIHQVIGNYLAWKQNPQGGVGGDFNPPVQYSAMPLPKISD